MVILIILHFRTVKGELMRKPVRDAYIYLWGLLFDTYENGDAASCEILAGCLEVIETKTDWRDHAFKIR